MAENSVDDLHYGHYGEISYNTQNRSWNSRRDTGVIRKLKQVGFPVQYATASIEAPSVPLDEKIAWDVKWKLVRNFVGAYPETAPVATILHGLLPDSQETFDHFHDEEYSIGDLIAVGRARAIDVHGGGSRHVMHSVLAIPGGDSGNCVRIMEMRSARQGWEQDHSIWLDTFDMAESEAAVWQSDSGHVRQICFAQQVEDDTTLLAVRTATAITILRPLYHNVPTLRVRPLQESAAPSRIVPNPLITFKMPPLGDAECVDVAFNPWYQRQLAAVNSVGCFVIWTFQGKQLVEAENLGGAISNYFVDDEENRDAFHNYDGWHKISWVGNSSVLVVCNRKHLEAFEMRGQIVVASGIDILATHSSPWILDMRISPVRNDDLFITTTTHIIMVHFRLDHTSGRSEGFRGSFDTVLSMRHFRDASDSTLQLTFRPTSSGFTGMLFSRKTSLVTEFRYEISSTDSSSSISASGPFEIVQSREVSEAGNLPENIRQLLSLLIVPIAFGGLPFQSNRDSLGTRYQSSGYTFHEALQLSPSLSLAGQLFRSFEDHRNDSGKSRDSAVVVPTWKRLRKRYAPRKPALVWDDFLVDDDEANQSGLDEPTVRRNIHSRIGFSRGRTRPLNKDEVRAIWSVQNESVFERVISTADERGVHSDGAFVDIAEILVEHATLQPTLQTLYSALSERLTPVSDLEDIPETTSIEHIQSLISDPRVQIGSLANGNLMGFDNLDFSLNSIVAFNQKLRAVCLDTLPRKTREKAHSKTEHLIKLMARNLFLASSGMRMMPETKQDAADSISQVDMPTQQVSQQDTLLTSSPPTSSRTIPYQSSQVQSSQLPSSYLPTPSRTPSVAPVIPPATTSCLGAYTTISNLPQSFSNPLSNILAHWATSSDPLTYDWEATAARISGKAGGLVSGSAMSAADRERQQRRMERQTERERQRDERLSKRRRLDSGGFSSQSFNPSQSHLSTGFLSSQPTQDQSQLPYQTRPQHRTLPTIKITAESQPTMPERLRSSPGIAELRRSLSPSHLQHPQELQMASQAEPGRFGGRPQKNLGVGGYNAAGRLQMAVRDRRLGQGGRKAGF